MTAIPGSVRFTGFVAPSDSTDTYAVTDDTYNRGGFRPVADTTARDAIPEDRRKVGMLVYCVSEAKYYQCTVATSPPTWEEASMGGAITAPLTMYVDGTAGDDANDGLAWGTAKKTFGFLIGTATDALPKEINAAFTCYFRNDIRARDADGHFLISGFYGSGSMTFIGTLTAVETFTATAYQNDIATRGSRIWIQDPTKTWTPEQWRRHFVGLVPGSVAYPVYSNDETTLYMALHTGLAGAPAGTIYSAPELLEELESDPGVKYDFGAYPSLFFGVRQCGIPVNFENLWLDEAVSFSDAANFLDCYQVNLTRIAATSMNSSNIVGINHQGCYYNLSNYGYVLDGYSASSFWNCAFHSLDDTGWGYNSYDHAYATLYRCTFSRQLFGVYLSHGGTVLSQEGVYFADCDVGMAFYDSIIELVNPGGVAPQTRFDTCAIGIHGQGAIVLMDTVSLLAWDVGTEILFGTNDEGTFADLAAKTLKGRAGLDIIYSNLDFDINIPNEYDNAVSGLTGKNYQEAIDELAASSGGGPVTPEFSISSPRAIVDGDHNGELLAAAVVLGGFLYTIDHSVTPGTTVRIGCIGYELKVICGADTIIMGAGAFIAGIVGLGFGSAGHYVDLIYIGETTPGTYAWGIVGGSGVATEVDGLGAYTTAQFAFNGTGAYVTSLEETAIDLVDDTDFTAVEAVPYVTEGMGYGIVVTPTTATGNLTVILYQDAARLEPVYTMVIDLSDADTYRSPEAFGFELETAGTLYGTAFVSGVGVGETFDIEVTALGLQPTATPIPLATPYGDGIEDDGLGKPQVAFPSDGGFAFALGKLTILPDTTADVYPTLGPAGVAIANAVTTTTDEDIAAKKRFTAVGMDYLAAAGPPAAGTYLAGHEVLDLNGVKWRCISDGTPGTWILVDFVADDVADYETGLLTPGDSEVVEILTTGDIGFFQHIRVWGVVADPDNYTTEFRVRVYETSSILGREMVWQGVGAAHQSYLTAILPAATIDCTVDNEDMFETDEACVVYASVGRYELARIASRAAATLSFDEVLVDASSWAADTLVCSVAQFDMVPFRNTDGTPANRGRVFLQIRNDHEANEAIFYVQVMPLCTGVTGNSIS